MSAHNTLIAALMVWRASERDWKQCSILGSTLCRAAIWSTQCWNMSKKCAECWSFVLGFKRRAETLKDDRDVRFNLGHYAGLTFQSPKEERHLFSEPSTAANIINWMSEAAASLRFQKEFHGIRPHRHWGDMTTWNTHPSHSRYASVSIVEEIFSVLDQEKG